MARLPIEARKRAHLAYELFAADPFHESLQFKQLSGRIGLWSVRIGFDYRALGWRTGDEIVWFWIGTHSEYDQLVRRLR